MLFERVPGLSSSDPGLRKSRELCSVSSWARPEHQLRQCRAAPMEYPSSDAAGTAAGVLSFLAGPTSGDPGVVLFSPTSVAKMNRMTPESRLHLQHRYGYLPSSGLVGSRWK